MATGAAATRLNARHCRMGILPQLVETQLCVDATAAVPVRIGSEGCLVAWVAGAFVCMHLSIHTNVRVGVHTFNLLLLPSCDNLQIYV